jgi:hypothetical protein
MLDYNIILDYNMIIKFNNKDIIFKNDQIGDDMPATEQKHKLLT